MANAKLTITGIFENGYKINDDNIVTAILKCKTSETVPKGLKQLGESIYILYIPSKTWDKVKNNISKETKVLIKGEQKASINQKGVPFIYVNVFEISIIETKELKHKENVKNKPISPINEKAKPKDYNKIIIDKWYKENIINTIKLSDVIITEKIHSEPKVKIYIKDINSNIPIAPITVRKLDDEKYTLVMGVSSYFLAKALDEYYIKAVITDKTHSELIDYLGIKESGNSWTKDKLYQ